MRTSEGAVGLVISLASQDADYMTTRVMNVTGEPRDALKN